MCEVLGIARSSVYERSTREPTRREVCDSGMALLIKDIHQQSRENACLPPPDFNGYAREALEFREVGPKLLSAAGQSDPGADTRPAGRPGERHMAGTGAP
jgi:hypothetical protein